MVNEEDAPLLSALKAKRRALAEAAKVLSSQDQAVQLRYLQTLVEIAGDKSSTIVFPVPIDVFDKFKS